VRRDRQVVEIHPSGVALQQAGDVSKRKEHSSHGGQWWDKVTGKVNEVTGKVDEWKNKANEWKDQADALKADLQKWKSKASTYKAKVRKWKSKASTYRTKVSKQWKRIKTLKLTTSKYLTSASAVKACLTSTGSDVAKLRCFGTVLNDAKEGIVSKQLQKIEEVKTCFKNKTSVATCVTELYPKAPSSITKLIESKDTPKNLEEALDCAQKQTSKEKTQECFLSAFGEYQNTPCAKITSKTQGRKCFRALITSILARMKLVQMESLGKLKVPDLSLMVRREKR